MRQEASRATKQYHMFLRIMQATCSKCRTVKNYYLQFESSTFLFDKHRRSTNDSDRKKDVASSNLWGNIALQSKHLTQVMRGLQQSVLAWGNTPALMFRSSAYGHKTNDDVAPIKHIPAKNCAESMEHPQHMRRKTDGIRAISQWTTNE